MGKLSESAKQKIREKATGRVLSEETKQKCSASHKALQARLHEADPSIALRHQEARKRAHATWRSKNPGYRRELRRQSPKRFMLGSARSRAKDRNIAFNLTEADIEIPSICPALGTPIILGATAEQRWNSPSIDRIDSAKGYEKGNVVVVSYRANTLKNAATVDEMRRLLAFYEQFEQPS